MSLIPFILDLADELHEFSRCLANGADINDFGFGLYTGSDQQHVQQHHYQQQQQQQQSSPRRSRTPSFSSFWMPSKRHHPYNRIKSACCGKSSDEGVPTPEKTETSSSIGGTPGKSASYSVVNKNGFQVSMNVKQFAPNELSVKTIDNCIVVEGRHDDKEDGHGVISRHFVRKYMLPKGYDPNDVLSTLSSDGILTVKAPPPPPPSVKDDEPNERIIEIQPTPGPTPVLVVSAKETPAKETPTTKQAATPSARLECHLPEKRQKLDMLPEQKSTQTTTPLTVTYNETSSASVTVTKPTTETETEAEQTESNDVEMERADDEQIIEIVVKQPEQKLQQQQQKSDVAGCENNTEKNSETIEKVEKKKLINETENKSSDDSMPELNGDSKDVCGKIYEACSFTDVNENTAVAAEETTEIPIETKTDVQKSIENSNAIEMEIDGDNQVEYNDNGDKIIDNTDETIAANKTAATEAKTNITSASSTTVIAAAADDVASKKNTDLEKNKNVDISSNRNTTTTTTITTISANNHNNNTTTNTNTIANTNSTISSVADNTENSIKDRGNSGNGIVTGEIPVDIPKSADTDGTTAAAAAENADTTSSNADNKAESADGQPGIETAVLLSNDIKTTASIIDDVALLKAATADPADVREENIALSESMDGITTEDSIATATADNVECSLFAKKAHLDNGNNTSTATPLVGTEEMAN